MKMVKRRQTNRATLKKRKVYQRKTRGGQIPPALRNKPLPKTPLPPHLRNKPLPLLPEVPNPSPEHSPIHVLPHPPPPLFRRPSHTPPTSGKPGFSRRVKKRGNLRRTRFANANSDLRLLSQQQERISAILARGSDVVDDAALERELQQYE